MNIFKTLGEKPWLAEASPAAPAAHIPEVDTLDAARIVLKFIMAIVSVLFFLFIITFLARSQYPDFQALAGQPWQPLTDASRLWFNTGILAAASLAMQFGLWGSQHGKIGRAIAGISAALCFSVLFLVAQLNLWDQLQSMGFYVSSNPANSYFYLLTAVHGLHLMGGLIVLANVAFRVWYDDAPENLSGPLQLCATYWHFLLAVWLVLFALLTSTPATINALAAMCGF
ncbi:MAG: cytochrome c oxidase subunit 3 [Halieaceae bacterium]|jgi:cytochrome c oxidase subunit 3